MIDIYIAKPYFSISFMTFINQYFFHNPYRLNAMVKKILLSFTIIDNREQP